MALEVSEQKEQLITISEKAYNQVKAVIDAQEHDNLFLRVYVQGGCGGVSYGMAVDMRQMPDDHEFMYNELKVVIDRISMPYIDGATIDFEENEGKPGFRVTNPNAADLMKQTGGCGCGSGTGGCGSASGAASGCGGGSCGSSGGGCC